MITLDLKRGEIRSRHAFAKERIVIGSSQEADIIVDDADIEAEHLVIVKEGDGYKAFNSTNDPFISLNTLPFGKRALKDGDLLSLRSLALQIHYLQSKSSPAEIEQEAELEAEEQEQCVCEEEPSLDLLMPTTALRASPQEIEELLQHFIPPKQKEKPQTLSSPPPLQEQRLTPTRGTPYLMWTIVWMMIATVFYLYLATQQRITPFDEREAARGVSDVAMTLLYAKINHLKTSEIDANSPSSLRTLSRYVVYPRYTYALQSGEDDHLSAGRHTIEVYSSENPDQFFVVARPQSPFLPIWWNNASSIALDSNDMRLRKVEDIEAYDLLNENTSLTEAASKQLTSMLSQEPLVPLSSLAQEGHAEFRLPLLLQERQENFVYNLPRYSSFTSLLLEKIIMQKRRIGAVVEGRYDEQLKNTLKLKDLILYTTQDLNRVIDLLYGFIPQKSSIEIVKIGHDGKAIATVVLHSLHEEIPAIENNNL